MLLLLLLLSVSLRATDDVSGHGMIVWVTSLQWDATRHLLTLQHSRILFRPYTADVTVSALLCWRWYKLYFHDKDLSSETRLLRLKECIGEISAANLQALQSVLNSAAQLIMWKRKYDRITATLRDDHLHWLPVRQRIMYKLCTTVYNLLQVWNSSILSDSVKLFCCAHA